MTAQPEVPESGRRYNQALSNCSRAARVQCAAAGEGGAAAPQPGGGAGCLRESEVHLGLEVGGESRKVNAAGPQRS